MWPSLHKQSIEQILGLGLQIVNVLEGFHKQAQAFPPAVSGAAGSTPHDMTASAENCWTKPGDQQEQRVITDSAASHLWSVQFFIYIYKKYIYKPN